MINDNAYRAWDKSRGIYHHGCSNVMVDTSGLIFWQFGFNSPEPVKQDEFVIQRYTTMDDKNVTPIFDGDILSFYQAYYVVNWNAYKWMSDYDGNNINPFFDWAEATVVGNIFEGITIRERLGTGHHDGDGMEICIGDHISSSYGIPPLRIEGIVEDKRGLPFIKTPGHHPSECYLREFIEYLGVVFIDRGVG